ncbi:hypothetical protein CKM354_000713700 [Cercospora kikuchii]|uniref:Nucleotide-diphospho-sugar transferase n=1 Tax=Cercospora kikuchii TaxID=84275 RepID=A0A9P3CJK9_9PEZI|nr:uncharacterized protein CKM354_000713700 [Cercospora kikuchii]GIZ43928.1 hypothetical protein CKM354_000713700 [Cercospora kikuchii]
MMGSTDWSQYAYTQYVTTEHYLCNSVMIFESLARYNSKADRLLMFPENWATDTELEATTWDLLSKAKEEYGVKLQPVTLQTLAGEPTWADSLTKLLAFNQTQYKRVLSLDSDSTVLKPMDELFLLPPTTLAAPRAYWLPNQKDPVLSSQLLLIQPSAVEFNRILNAFDTRLEADYDMEIINHLYNSSAMVLPHRPYNLLSGEFKLDHAAYLGSSSEIWDPDLIINEAKYVHFSDWPLPKPWIIADEETVENVMPQCVVLDTRKSVFEGVGNEVVEDCRDREIWLGLYADFKRRRQEVCGLGLFGEGDEY